MQSDRSHHTAEGSSRKRLKISRDASRPAGTSLTPEATPLMSPAKKAKKEPAVENDLHTDGTPCHHEQSLRSLNGNLDSMRQLITCKICQRFLYEPYALACGHTFCYSCLSQWLGQNRKKTCPDCRTVIKEQPSPSYLIREMVLIFVSKSELLPDGETSEEHHQCAREEAEIVAKDKANTDVRTGGLFKGSFRRAGLMPLVAIRDTSDNVDRCPQCLHEVEDGRCNTCDVRVRGQHDDLAWSDEDSDESEELDHDLDADDEDLELGLRYPEMFDPDVYDEEADGFDYDYDLPPGLYPNPNMGPVSDVSDSDEDDHDSEMEGFIDDDQVHILDESSDANEGDSDGTIEVRNPHPHRRRRAAPIVVSDDDEEEEEEDEQLVPPRRSRVIAVQAPSSRASEDPSSAGAGVSEASDDDDDEGPITASQRSRTMRNYRREMYGDETGDDSDDGTEATNRSAYGGFSPPQHHLIDDSNEDDDNDNEHEGEHGYQNIFDGYSFTSGPTEQSVDHDIDDEDRESDGSGDGWGPNSRSAIAQDHVLTRAAGTRANGGHVPAHGSSSHRLHTLGSRRSRYADPPSDSPPSYSSLFPGPDSDLPPLHRQRQHPSRRVVHANHSTRRANPAFQPVRPTHPFNLDNTLASINQSRQTQQRHTSNSRFRGASAVSSQSSIGGVSVASGSSGSSRTVRAEENEGGGRRRPFAIVDDDDDDSEY